MNPVSKTVLPIMVPLFAITPACGVSSGDTHDSAVEPADHGSDHVTEAQEPLPIEHCRQVRDAILFNCKWQPPSSLPACRASAWIIFAGCVATPEET